MGVYKLHKSPAFIDGARPRRGVRGRARQSEASYCNLSGAAVARYLVFDELGEGVTRFPPRKFCDVLGFPCNNTHAKYHLQYYDFLVYKHIKAMTQNSRDEFRALRGVKKGF